MERLERYHDKILDLFHHRKIEWLFTRSEVAGDSGFYRQLMDLQARIYDLDDYLESTWQLSPARLASFWNAIENAPAFEFLPRENVPELLGDIRQYQSQEMLVRTGGDITLVPIAEFYHFKTCDVRLMRKLIYLRDPRLQRQIPESIWSYFDHITEVEDDLNDQSEDIHTHNVNRYLAIRQLQDATALQHEYSEYIEQTFLKAQAELNLMDFTWIDDYREWLLEARSRVLPMIG